MKKFTLFALAAATSLVALAKPDNPSDFVMTFDINGGNPVVTGSFVCPTHHYSYSDPQPLEKITKVKVTRGCYDLQELDIPVYTREEELEPGTRVEFSDEFGELEFGYTYTYRAYIYDENNEESYGASFYLYSGIKPGKPEISVSVGERGSLPVILTVTAPTQTSDGNTLTVPLTELKITRYNGYNDEPTLTVINDPEAGMTYTWNHEDAAIGEVYYYRAYAVCPYGTSEYNFAQVFVGEDVPGKVTNVALTENEDGSVTISWEAPTIGKNGGYVDPETIMYKVIRTGDQNRELATGLTELSYTDPLDDLDGPTIIKYEIDTYNNLGDGDYQTSQELVKGPAYSLPFVENFNSGSGWYMNPDKKWTFTPEGYSGNWDIESSEWYTGLTGVDGDEENDEGFARAYLSYADPGDTDEMKSSDISLNGASYPVLSFYVASQKDNQTSLKVEVIPAGEETVVLADFKPGTLQDDMENTLWKKVVLPVENRNDKNVQLVFTTIIPEDATSFSNVYLDKIILADYPGVEEVTVSVTDGGNYKVTWNAPHNSFGEEPDSYTLGDYSNETISEPCYEFTDLSDALRYLSIVPNYGDIAGKQSPLFNISFPGTITGIGNVNAEASQKVEFFDMNGLRVANPVKGSTLIRKTVKVDGSISVDKIVVR